MNVIFNLTTDKKFAKLSCEERLNIKKNGRPLPDLDIVVTGSSRGKLYNRQFHREIYYRNNWICGCNIKNALYCFPCVLFGGDKTWTEKGMIDLVHLRDKIRKHENSRNHLYNQIELGLLGSVDTPAQLNIDYWIGIQKQNEEVTQKRYILSKIINCIKFCGEFDLPLHGDDEEEDVQNPEFFRGLLNFSSELDKTLEALFKTNNVSKVMLNDLLDCILEVCYEEIEIEISKSQFLALIAEQMTDLSAKCHLVLIFRYIKEGEIIERFWSFLNPIQLDVKTLSKTILNTIKPLVEEDKYKLIAQSYDGISVMSEQSREVQNHIQEIYPYAYYIHCYAHQLNLILVNAASDYSEVRAFFGKLHTICTFSNNSSKGVSILHQITGKKVSTCSASRNFDLSMVSVIYENRNAIIECMEELELHYNHTICGQASIIGHTLKDSTFVFWLTYFHYITLHVGALHDQLQSRKVDSTLVQKALDDFQNNIISIRNKIDEIDEEASKMCATSRQQRHQNFEADQRVAAVYICDAILNSVRNRFTFTGHFEAVNLLASDSFIKYFVQFPHDLFNEACSAYSMLDQERLKTELIVIYSRADCRKLNGILSFYKFLIKNNLEEPLREVKKLAEILLTTPMMTAESERCCTTLKRVKIFLRSSSIQDRLTALAMLSVEKQFVTNISNFNEKVIDKFFVKKKGCLDCVLKI